MRSTSTNNVSPKRVRSVLVLSSSYVLGQHPHPVAVVVVQSIRSHVHGLHLAREGRESVWIAHKGLEVRGKGSGCKQ